MRDVWNNFVSKSRNATFLFYREYMDYHSKRFQDVSCLALKNGKLKALLPANIEEKIEVSSPGKTLYSHKGLTYGGWLLPRRHFDAADMLQLFEVSIKEFQKEGIRRIVYKSMPSIYAGCPSEEDQYALFRFGAKLIECDMSVAIDQRSALRMSETRRQLLRDTSCVDFRIEETFDVVGFMTLVTKCLHERHGVAPVHSAEEMTLLHSRFPGNIRFFQLLYENKVEAGVCIYDTGLVAHCQYIATTPLARSLNLLTPLHHYLITDVFASRRFYDFGTCNQLQGDHLNVGLLRQKMSFGGTGVAYNHYCIEL